MPVDLPLSLLVVLLLVLGLVWYHRTASRRRRAARQLSGIADQAEALHEAGRDDEAIALIGRELELSRGSIHSNLDRVRHAMLLRDMALHLHLAGRLAEALPYATEAADLTDSLAERYPADAVAPSLTLGLLLSGLGQDEAAVHRFRQARRYVVLSGVAGLDASADAERVYVLANLAMALRRTGEGAEALALAAEAVDLTRYIKYAKLPPHAEGTAGWAHGALALTLTDAGEDGRVAAADALAIWQGLTERGVYGPDSEGLAASLFFMGYALRPFDPAPAAGFARRAVDMLTRLESGTPGRGGRRLGEAQALVEALAGTEQP
ncbi:hypothetical protein [Catellatospora bangladeshensis]|uniref:Tetratricopeptide repeat protein n=1 Tax=Catellatospora bangladeshensis TaxID=310355 RepID=A0A8J3NIZ8_9ACTN|nr:hypothetical protein [Catellatospora bangladeshensis]GIF82960.1 hypothetical protein Cba03nite_43090 [Catellatospora bangladeshensis]